MTMLNAGKISWFDYFMLLPILGLAFYLVFIPHQSYPYALHVDEWVHLARSRAIMQAGSTTFVDPFSGVGTVSLSSNLEAGFHLFWGVFQAISGISWMAIFRYFPGVIFVITVLSVYIAARREGFGWEAAFFACLIPSTIGVLGPVFLVPASVGLLFTPLIIFLAFNFRSIWSYLLIFVLTVFLLSIHAPSAIFPIIVLAPYILLNLKGNFKHSLATALALALPFLIIFPWIFNLLLPTAKSLLSPTTQSEFVVLPRVIQTYGFLPILFSLLGVFVLAIRGGNKNYGLILGLLAMLLMLVSYYTFNYGIWIMYERGLTFMMLVASIVAGAGLMVVKNLTLPASFDTWLTPFITRNAGRFLCLVLIAVTLFVAIPERQSALYYQMIDEEDYQAFVWIEEHLGKDYQKAILDPWKATAFTAITGKTIYTRTHSYPTDKDRRAYDFLEQGSASTTFLKENGISIVYTRVYDTDRNKNFDYSSNNPDLTEVARNIYLLKD
ncbi:MAG: hypothetical protein Q8O55_03265 [Dehalococcoidales bacterium]|nr:hypothetical protein [Dehalococcoidales bacterium]